MDTPGASRSIAALVALKPLPAAKSRLSELPATLRMRLARSMAIDTIAALAQATDQVLVITDQPDFSVTLDEHGISAVVVDEPTTTLAAESASRDGEASLNAALSYGDELLRSAGVHTVLACVGDLPALRPDSVRRILAQARELAAAGQPRSFVADHSRHGTTMVLAHGIPLNPRFGRGPGIGSAERHRLSGAKPVLVADADDARWDVDTLADLRAVVALGVGPATATMLDLLELTT